MIVVDTSVLYAATDRSDTHHERCRDWILGNDQTLLVPPTVIAETCYLIDRGLGPQAEAAFLDDVGTENGHAYQLVSLLDGDIRRMAELVRQYADRHLGGTDASIIALCERLGVETVATLNAATSTTCARSIPAHSPSCLCSAFLSPVRRVTE